MTPTHGQAPESVERAGAAAVFEWDEYFKAGHTNRHTQRAYLLAARRFLAWAEGRAGAVTRLRVQDFRCDGVQFMLRFTEKGRKSREIPVRHDLEGYIRAYLEAAGLAVAAKESPLFRACNGRHGGLSDRPLDVTSVGELVKRRLKAAGQPLRLSPHSFRVVRALLTPGSSYEQAVKTFVPYRHIQEPNETARQALRRIIAWVRRENKPAFLFVNNRLEGNAPGTIEAVVEGLGR